jgi:hypothetical protein
LNGNNNYHKKSNYISEIFNTNSTPTQIIQKVILYLKPGLNVDFNDSHVKNKSDFDLAY